MEMDTMSKLEFAVTIGGWALAPPLQASNTTLPLDADQTTRQRDVFVMTLDDQKLIARPATKNRARSFSTIGCGFGVNDLRPLRVVTRCFSQASVQCQSLQRTRAITNQVD
jgi:hypothetical protein